VATVSEKLMAMACTVARTDACPAANVMDGPLGSDDRMKSAMSDPADVEPPPSALKRFGFREHPFSGQPDIRFIYRSQSHTRALESVLGILERGDRVVVVTGAEGLGKSTLCLALSSGCPVGVTVALVDGSQPDAKERIRALAAALWMANAAARIHASRQRPVESAPTGQALATGKAPSRTVLIVDDAQDLEGEVLQPLITQSGGSGGTKVQVVLVGHPDLEDTITRLGVVGERSIPLGRLAPLSDLEVREFVERRMWVARGGVAGLLGEDSRDARSMDGDGAVSGLRFSGRALAAISRVASGNPRLVNQICERALAICDPAGGTIGPAVISQATEALRSPAAAPSVWGVKHLAIGVLAIVLVVIALTAALVRSPEPARDVVASTSGEEDKTATEETPSPDRRFETFRQSTLERATRLSSVPDVKGLLQLHDDVVRWQQEAKYDGAAAVAALLRELERLTNDARLRQLDLDRQLFLEDQKKRSM
jgi:type II secretory pathway predicted ATPase ExeA